MKTLEDYVALPYRVKIVEGKNKGGFVVSFPGLPGCIICGQTAEMTASNTQDAKRAWVAAALGDGAEVPKPDSLENYSGQFKLRIPRSLCRVLAQHSR